MTIKPKKIRLDQLKRTILFNPLFKNREHINIYLGSNAATPTASIETLTASIRRARKKIPFVKFIHLLLQGSIPFIRPGLQDRMMSYSVFSNPEVGRAANEGRAFYLPCTLANLDVLIGQGCKYAPDVVILKVARHPVTGEYSMGLSVEAMHTAIDAARVVVAELDPAMPFTYGQSVVSESSIHYVIENGLKPCYSFAPPNFDNLSETELRIGRLITEYFIKNGSTLQVGIGKIPDAVVGTVRASGVRDLGVQTELYGDGLMLLQREGIVNNLRKKADMGYSTTSLIMGSGELYDWVRKRAGVLMQTCLKTNSAVSIQQNAPFVSINTAMGVDLRGNVWADFVGTNRYYSGVGGQPDFARALVNPRYGYPIIAMSSRTGKGYSKIVRTHPSGVAPTICSYDGVIIVTEYGIADLRGQSIGNKALALATIAHPSVRDELLKEIQDNKFFTKPHNMLGRKVPDGVILYK